MENEPIQDAAEAPGFQENLHRGVSELEQHAQTTRDQIQNLNEQAVRFIQEKPVAAIGIAFGVGYIFGKLAAKRWLV